MHQGVFLEMLSSDFILCQKLIKKRAVPGLQTAQIKLRVRSNPQSPPIKCN